MNGQTAPVTMDLFFPITGYLDDGEEPVYEVSDNFVFRYRCEISDIIQEHQERGDGNIASYYRGNAGVKAKLLHAEWGVEEYPGDILLGKVQIELREELTEKEKADLIDWVRGQNSDGAFECLDELPIETGYGGLAISLWNDSDDYFVCDREELDEYMSQHNSIQMGGM